MRVRRPCIPVVIAGGELESWLVAIHRDSGAVAEMTGDGRRMDRTRDAPPYGLADRICPFVRL